MKSDDFEWDDHKANINLRKHGVSFQEALTVLDDPGVYTSEDFRSEQESRYVSIGYSLQY